MSGQRHGAAFVVGAIVGGLAGTTCALVAAPRAGEQTRAELKARLQALTDRAARAIERARAEGEQLVERVVASLAAFAGEEEPQAPRPAEREMAPSGIDEVIEISEPEAPTGIAGPAGGLEGTVAPPSAGIDVVIDGPRPSPGPPLGNQTTDH